MPLMLFRPSLLLPLLTAVVHGHPSTPVLDQQTKDLVNQGVDEVKEYLDDTTNDNDHDHRRLDKSGKKVRRAVVAWTAQLHTSCHPAYKCFLLYGLLVNTKQIDPLFSSCSSLSRHLLSPSRSRKACFSRMRLAARAWRI